MIAKDILSKVFEITRDPRDGLHFLGEFKSLSPESFAILYSNVDTIIESSEALFSDIKLLSRLELFPVLVFEQESIEYLSLFFPKNNSIQYEGMFPYQFIDGINHLLEDVKNSILAKKIPILVWQKQTHTLADFLSQVLFALHSNKVIFLHHEGPIYDEDTGKVISLIPTGERIEHYKSNFALSDSNRELHFLQLADTLVEARNDPRFSVVLTSPYTLLRELFTVKGSGTLVKRENLIRKITALKDTDEKKLFQLIETSFRKTLKPHFKSSKFDLLFLEETYQGCAWLVKTDFGFLLSKFAVNETARGAGVGRDLWDLISNQALPLLWRSKPTNNINKWYMKVAQGIEKDDNWFYYWLGMPRENIPSVIQFLKSIPEDFF